MHCSNLTNNNQITYSQTRYIRKTAILSNVASKALRAVIIRPLVHTNVTSTEALTADERRKRISHIEPVKRIGNGKLFPKADTILEGIEGYVIIGIEPVAVFGRGRGQASRSLVEISITHNLLNHKIKNRVDTLKTLRKQLRHFQLLLSQRNVGVPSTMIFKENSSFKVKNCILNFNSLSQVRRGKYIFHNTHTFNRFNFVVQRYYKICIYMLS